MTRTSSTLPREGPIEVYKPLKSRNLQDVLGMEDITTAIKKIENFFRFSRLHKQGKMDKNKSFGLNIYNIQKRLGLRENYLMYALSTSLTQDKRRF